MNKMHHIQSSFKLSLLMAVAMLMSTGMALVPTAMASAASQKDCTSSSDNTHGHWSTSKTYRYPAGDWCMQDPSSSARLVWQADGNLVEYSGSSDSPSQAVYASGTNGYGKTLDFSTSGHLFILNSGGHIIWETGNTGYRSNSDFYLEFFQDGAGEMWINQLHGSTWTEFWLV